MPGFILIKNNLKNDFLSYKNTKLLVETIEEKKFSIQRRTIKKFLDDKIFYNNLKFLIVLEGVILNKEELIQKYKEDNFKNTIIKMYLEIGEKFFQEFRGSFSGVFYDKEKDIKLIYTDQIGDKQIFYKKINEDYIIGTDIEYIINILQINNIKYSLNEKGVYALLNHGFLLEDMTLFENIKKVIAGTYIKISKGVTEIKEYHRFSNKETNNKSDIEIIEEMDILFKKALSQQINKNKEYGYKNYSPLSAGLDSRVVNFGLEELKAKNILNFTYSQTKYYDENIPKEIANDLKRHWIFKSLDNGLSIKDNIDEMIKINAGNVLYYGPGQVNDILKILNYDDIGVIHTGMLGDVVVGTFFKNLNKNIEFKISDGSYSQKLITKLEERISKKDIRNYENIEIYNFYNRGFNGANMGSPLTFQQLTESYSPFYNVEFLEYCLAIPVAKRLNHNIYDKWILRKYPRATKYLHNGIRKIRKKTVYINILNRRIAVHELPNKGINFILRKLSLKKNNMESQKHMNPLDYWYNTNSQLKEYMDNYYKDNIEKISSKEIKLDCEELYLKGNTVEKTQVLTLLGVIKKYF